MALDVDLALQRVLERGDGWQSWRALRLGGDDPGSLPSVAGQDDLGAFAGETGRSSPGATGMEICHLVVLGLADSAPAAIAADWLEDMRTPAGAWLDAPDDVPGEPESPAAGRVWATASTTCALLALGRDPGPRPFALLRAESDSEGRFTGGAYPTFAAAGAYWLGSGPKTEMAEWALRWTREWSEGWWGPWEETTALTFWAAARIPAEHASVDAALDRLQDEAPPAGWDDDLELTIRALALLQLYG